MLKLSTDGGAVLFLELDSGEFLAPLHLGKIQSLNHKM
jgi:hypothetical protein